MPENPTRSETITPKGNVRAHREELQRVQIGLVGLAAVLLVVTLANLVVDSARRDSGGEAASLGTEMPIAAGAGGANTSSAQKPSGNEPLADLGVTPTTQESTVPVLPSPVPDLEPDPQLRERMDQDPEQPQPTP